MGAAIGAGTKLPLEEEDRPGPQAIDKPLAAAKATLRPLAAVLVVCTVAGLAGWLIQVARGVDEVRFGRARAHRAHRGGRVRGRARDPADRAVRRRAVPRRRARRARAAVPRRAGGGVPGPDAGLRIFSYNDAIPGYVLLPALILLLGLVALGALYAGFAAAQAAETTSLGGATAWGALTGPVWAVTMAILTALAGGAFHGDASGPSVFGVFLLGGLILGATGGALAESARETL